MLECLKTFNNDYAEAVQALTPFVLGVFSFLYLKFVKEKQLKEGDAASIVKPTFWSVGRKFKILAVHQFEKSNDVSGYKHLGQNSRPDQWEKLITVKSSLCRLRHKVVPKNKDDILTVVLSRNGTEKWRTIEFNK